MNIAMDFKHLKTIEDLKQFLQGTKRMVLKAVTIDEKYEVIQSLIDTFHYPRLTRKEKHTVLRVLKLFTGYKHSQLGRLIDEAMRGTLCRKEYVRINLYRKYIGADIQLLEETDAVHYRLSAEATHEILRREYEVFGHEQYKNVSHVSVSHVKNLRQRDEYKAKNLEHTHARIVPIGETRKPEPNGRPGSIRIDTVHQRDVYYLNVVDEVTQWEVMVAVPSISEYYMKPALEHILKAYPFVVFNFHSDRGSEFVNQVVADILNRLLIKQTKSRSRHCNDQALVEGKNGSIIRKNFGYGHISKEFIEDINTFLSTWFNTYLNYHRPCGYVTGTRIDYKGREHTVYGQYTTPYEKLKEISTNTTSPAGIYLKENISFEDLNKIAYAMSDNEYATRMRDKQHKLFDIINSLKSL